MTAERIPAADQGRLRDRVLAASLAARAPGRAVPEPPAISPSTAFARAADRFDTLLASLSDSAWRQPVLRDLDVQGLVGHLIGVEEHVLRCLTGEGADLAEADHVASTQPAAQRQVGAGVASTRAAWRSAVDATLGAIDSGLAASPDQVVAVYGLRMPVGALLVVRSFELWTHENDIRRAVGAEPSVPDASTLRLMTDLAVRLLPHGFGRIAGDSAPCTVRMVLTGPGGGTWDVAFGRASTPSTAAGTAAGTTRRPVPPTRIVTDAVAFCRLTANRVAPEQVPADVTGDTELAARVLAGAASLALD